MPSSDDLPTPEPAKMPRRWPRPHGTSVSSARTPRSSRVLDAARGRAAPAARRRSSAARRRSSRRAAVDRAAEAVEHAAEQLLGRRCSEKGLPVGSTAFPGPIAAQLAERHQQRAAVAEADDLGGDRARGCGRTRRADLADSRAQAGGLDHEADQVRDAARGGRARSRAAAAPRRRGRAAPSVMADGASASRTISAGAGELRVDAGVDLGLVGVDDAAAAVDAALGTTSTRARPPASAMPAIGRR